MKHSPFTTPFCRAWAVISVLFLGLAGTSLEAKKGKTESGKTSASSVWKITSKTCTVYLAGSVHLLRAEDYPLPPVYDVAYEDSEELYFEVDLGAATDLATQMKIMKLGRLPEGETIKDRLSAETYGLLQDYLKANGIGGPLFETMKPGMLAITIASLEYMKLGAMPHLGVDMVYFKKATEDEKPIAGFETTEFQLGLFDSLSAEKQETMLLETLEQLEESREIGNRLIEAWKTGDVATLKEMLTDQVADDKEIGKALLYDRNRKWIPTIVKLLKGDKNAMVVVGAGHLMGKKSVVDYLGRRGYEAEQMRYEISDEGDSAVSPKGGKTAEPKPAREKAAAL